jgi:hypothetical protein
MGTIFILCCIFYMQYIPHHIESNTSTIGVWKRHGTAHKSYGRLRAHYYKVGDKVLLKKTGTHLRKLEAPRTRPQIVTAIYTNGSLCIKKGKVNETVKISRLFPYFEKADH